MATKTTAKPPALKKDGTPRKKPEPRAGAEKITRPRKPPEENLAIAVTELERMRERHAALERKQQSKVNKWENQVQAAERFSQDFVGKTFEELSDEEAVLKARLAVLKKAAKAVKAG